MKKNKPYGAAAALLAGALLGGLMTAPGAHAVDFRVKGVWIAMLEYPSIWSMTSSSAVPC